MVSVRSCLIAIVCVAVVAWATTAERGYGATLLETSNLTLMIEPKSERGTNFTIWRWPVDESDIENLVPPHQRNRWTGFDWKGPWSLDLDAYCVVGRDGTQVAIAEFDGVRGTPVAAFAVAAMGYKTGWSDCQTSPSVSADVTTAAGLKMGLTEDEVIKLIGKPTSKSGSTLVWRWPWPCTESDYNGETYHVKTGRLSVGLEGGRVAFFEVSGADDVSP